jgi:hypothetical protein
VSREDVRVRYPSTYGEQNVEKHSDIEMLLASCPEYDMASGERIAKRILQRISEVPDDKLPLVFGIFGPWGSGKTTVLAHLVKQLRELASETEPSGAPVIEYVNTWKHSGGTDIVSAIIYRVLRAVSGNEKLSLHRSWQFILRAGTKVLEHVSEYLKARRGIDPFKFIKDIIAVTGKNRRDIALRNYLTQADQIQEFIHEWFSESEQRIYVLVDELDRCDPEEAIDALKQLRTIVSVTGVRLVFIVALNPDVIAAALRSRYGVNGFPDQQGHQEAITLVEKFVDQHYSLNEFSHIDAYVKRLWESTDVRLAGASFIADVERKSTYEFEDGASGEVHPTITASFLRTHPVYGNLRAMDKALGLVIQSEGIPANITWAAWHIEMARYQYPRLLELIPQIADALIDAWRYASINLIIELAEQGVFESSQSIPDDIVWTNVKSPQVLHTESFTQSLGNRLGGAGASLEQGARAYEKTRLESLVSSLAECLDNRDNQLFLCNMGAVAFRDSLQIDSSQLDVARGAREALISNWDSVEPFTALRSMLDRI